MRLHKQKLELIWLHTKVHAVKGNIRYRIIESENNYYLLDIEVTPLFYLIPFLPWFHKYKVYAIDEVQAQHFMNSKEKQDRADKERAKTAILVPLMIPLSIVFGRMLINMGFNDIPLFQTSAINVATLVLTFIAISYFWRAMYKRNGEKVKHIITNQSLQTYEVKFYPKKKREYFQTFLYWFASLLFTMMGAALLIGLGKLIGLICFVIFLTINMTSFRSHLHVGKEYKAVFID